MVLVAAGRPFSFPLDDELDVDDLCITFRGDATFCDGFCDLALSCSGFLPTAEDLVLLDWEAVTSDASASSSESSIRSEDLNLPSGLEALLGGWGVFFPRLETAPSPLRAVFVLWVLSLAFLRVAAVSSFFVFDFEGSLSEASFLLSLPSSPVDFGATGLSKLSLDRILPLPRSS